MSGLWYHFPVLIANHKGFDVSLALKLSNHMEGGDPILIEAGQDGPISGSIWVTDTFGNRLGWLSARQADRFIDIYTLKGNKKGEFAFMMQFGWMMRAIRPTKRADLTK